MARRSAVGGGGRGEGGAQGSGQAQSSLDGFDAPDKPTDRLFFAIFPDSDTAARITTLAAQLALAQGLRGKQIGPARLHITLHHLGDFAGLPQGVVRDACAVAGAGVWPGFNVEFDRAASFAGRPRNLPFVLQGGDALMPLKDFQKTLGLALLRAGLQADPAARFVPHVTLLYDDQLVREQPVAPIRWMATELVLVHSLIGQTRHIALGRWPLHGAALSA